MILILSTYNDSSTSKVMEWLSVMGAEVYRINCMEDLQKWLCTVGMLNIGDAAIPDPFSNITSVWYRRRPHNTMVDNMTDDAKANDDIYAFFVSEQNALFASVCELLSDKKWLNRYYNSRISKTIQLFFATQVGLNIPTTWLVSSKTDMEKIKKNQKIIIKPIQDGQTISYKGMLYHPYTTMLTAANIKKLPAIFFPALIQQCINKNLEIRSFYLDGSFYSMAICSSFDKQTSVDFRRYNHQHPNRSIPYQLPTDVENQLHRLMEMLQLNSGSIDLILSSDGKYYFLEVNPVGQFGMVSIPCNYYLEKRIAEYLQKKHEN